jgi:BRCT domain type II-containing protein
MSKKGFSFKQLKIDKIEEDELEQMISPMRLNTAAPMLNHQEYTPHQIKTRSFNTGSKKHN